MTDVHQSEGLPKMSKERGAMSSRAPKKMRVILRVATTRFRTPGQRGLPELVHASLERQEVVKPLDDKEALRERQLSSRGTIGWPVDRVELVRRPAVSASKGQQLASAPDEISDCARKLPSN